MPMARKKVKRVHLLHKRISLLPLVFLFCFLFGGLVMHLVIMWQTKPVVETSKSSMKELPREIEKRLEESSSSATFRVPILLYHYVEYVKDKSDTTRESLNIEPKVFEAQVKTLRDGGFTFMTAKELGDVLVGRATLPKKPVVLTIDDGHWDVATDILPILKKYQAKATAYLIPGLLGEPDFMTREQVKEVIASRLVEIGAHTLHHVGLADKLLPIVKDEVVGSKNMLEKAYNIRVYSFAYPNGAFDEQAIRVVQAAGFTTAVSTIPGIEESYGNRYFLYRIRPGQRTGEELLTYLEQDTFWPYK